MIIIGQMSALVSNLVTLKCAVKSHRYLSLASRYAPWCWFLCNVS